MSYSKKAHLKQNIEAISLAFTLDRERRKPTAEEKLILSQYSGFGAIKAVLYPIDDIADWKSNDSGLFQDIQKLHQILQENSSNEKEYKDYVSSLKNSVLTSFYTPQLITDTIASSLGNNGVAFHRFLEPSAGAGAFVSAFQTIASENCEITSFEKDRLTGKVLSHLYSDNEVIINGYETIDNRYMGYYDVVASNIPFGDVRVFDPVFYKQQEYAYNYSTHSIHNYFFLKGVESLRKGGILAFITSQGVLNSALNRPIREWLMSRCNPVSVIRLPNNLMTENAGTEVGSDLIILQRTDDPTLTPDKERFIEISQLGNSNSYVNNWFQSLHRIVHTKSYHGKDLYGKDAMIYEHEGGVQGMAADLKEMLDSDLYSRLDLELYYKHSTAIQNLSLSHSNPQTIWEVEPQKEEQEPTQWLFNEETPVSEQAPVIQETPLVSLYDLFGFTQEERLQVKQKKTIKSKKKKEAAKQLSLFDPPEQTNHQQTNDKRQFVYPVSDSRQNEQLQMQRMLEEQEKKKKKLEPRSFAGDILTHYKEDTLVEQDNQIGHLKGLEKFNRMFHPIDIPSYYQHRYSLYIKLRDTYHELYNYEASEHTENTELRKNLNLFYDEFVRKYGNLNTPQNIQAIMMDGGGQEILFLERYKDKKSYKADIFNKPVAFNPDEITHTDNAIEALAASLNKSGKVNLDYICSLTDYEREKVIQDLKGLIHYNPLVREWETTAKFISGNVITKADLIKEYLEDYPDDELAKESLDRLTKSFPIPVPFDDLDFNFGERWIPTEIYSQFATALFSTTVTVNYLANIDEFSLQAKYYNSKITDQYAIKSQSRTFNGVHLMKHALHNTSPNITKKIKNAKGEEVNVRDGHAVQEANSKIEEIRNSFVEWLQEQSIETKDHLTELYNRKFNCFVKPTYDGSHQTFPGIDFKRLGIKDLYSSQKDCVWMLLQNGGGIVDHEAGGGKTLIMCCAAYEMKRLGLLNKPVIMGLKANVHQIAETFQKAYPNAKMLYPKKSDFTKEGRTRLFNEMKNNDWDVIILTHEQFGKIPQSYDIQQKILQEELDSVEENLMVAKQQGSDISNHMRRGLEKRKANLEAKIQEIILDIEKNKDEIIDFDMMGIDHLFVDESHKFKNLTFTTRHDRVAGIGNPEGSQRALNLLFAIRSIQQRTGKDLGVTFLSGTTISNSLTELYILFKYLRPKELERQNITTFDAWAAVYTEKSIDYEVSMTNQIIQRERFRHFIKVPELAAFYAEITDYRTGEDIGLDRPKIKRFLHEIPPTVIQQEFIEKIIKFLETKDATILGREKLSENEEKAISLIAMDYLRKVAMDMRLINSRLYDDDPDNKASICASIIADRYYKYNEHKVSQSVFCELGTPKPDQWHMYGEIKRKLVEDHGIPSHEIRFIQEAGSSEKIKKAIIDGMNEGNVRVTLGTAETLGTGVNAQKRAACVHILAPSWRPSDEEQEERRAGRPGNEFAKYYNDNEVEVHRYATQRTLDGYKFDLLNIKQGFIKDLKRNRLGSRRIDEGSMDDSGANYAEMTAIMLGKTELLQKIKLQKKITILESDKKTWNKGKSEARYKLETFTQQIKSNEYTIKKLEQDLNHLKQHIQYDEAGNKLNPIEIEGVNGHNPELIGKRLNEINETINTYGHSEQIGNLYGFGIFVKTEKVDKEGIEVIRNRFSIRGLSEISYSYNNGIIAKDPILAARNFLNALESIPVLMENHQSNIDKIEPEISLLQDIINTNWRKEPELILLKTQLTEIEKLIDESLVTKDQSEEEIEDAVVIEETSEKQVAVPPPPNSINDIAQKVHVVQVSESPVNGSISSQPENIVPQLNRGRGI